LNRFVRVGVRRAKTDWAGIVGRVTVDGGEGAQEQTADGCQDSGAFRGDAILGDQQQESGKKHVDVGGGLEFGELAGEGRADVGGIGLAGVELGVAKTEAGTGIELGQAAAAAGGGVVKTAVSMVGWAGMVIEIGGWMRGVVVHEFVPFWESGFFETGEKVLVVSQRARSGLKAGGLRVPRCGAE
jgi:hypothetical protein